MICDSLKHMHNSMIFHSKYLAYQSILDIFFAPKSFWNNFFAPQTKNLAAPDIMPDSEPFPNIELFVKYLLSFVFRQ